MHLTLSLISQAETEQHLNAREQRTSSKSGLSVYKNLLADKGGKALLMCLIKNDKQGKTSSSLYDPIKLIPEHLICAENVGASLSKNKHVVAVFL